MVKLPGVPQVEQVPLRSGGVPNVPRIPTGGGEDFGGAFFEVGARLQKAAENETKTREGLDRLRIMRQYRERVSELGRQTISEGDPLDPDVTRNLGKTIDELDQELMGSHIGRVESKAALLEQMQAFRLGTADKVANHVLNKREEIMSQEVGNETNDAIAQLQTDATAFDKIVREKFEAIDGLQWSDQKKAQAKDNLLGAMGEFTVKRSIEAVKNLSNQQDTQAYREAVESVQDALENPDFRRAWSPKTRNALLSEFNTAKKGTAVKTLSPDQLRAKHGVDAVPGVIYQEKADGELIVKANGKEETFTAGVALQDYQLPNGTTIKAGQEVFATKQQISEGLVRPRPQAALVNIGLQPPPTDITPEGALKAGEKPAGVTQTQVPGVGTVTTTPRVPQPTEPKPATDQPRDVGLFRFLTPKEQLSQKAQVDALRTNIDLIDKIQANIKANPTNYGAIGGIKKFGQSTLGVASDVGDALDIATGLKIKDQASSIFRKLTAEGLEKEIGIDFNPNLPKIELWENTLALQLAKLRLTQGDSEQRAITKVYEAAKSDTKLTGFTFTGDVSKRMEQIKEFFERELENTTKALSGQKPTDKKDDLNKQVDEILRVK